MNESPVAALKLDVGGADDLGPFLGFLGDQLGEVGRGAGKWFTTEVNAVLAEPTVQPVPHGHELRSEVRDQSGRSAQLPWSMVSLLFLLD